ncbi:MAG: hypothetical protein L6R39_000206 [Caloplaca ligustica]|nr:MAG: hypothetical protein L6R39_000206 [Caloplaca ligustica]
MAGLVRYGSSDDEEDGRRRPEEVSGATVNVAEGHAALGAAEELQRPENALIGPQVPPADLTEATDGVSRPLSPFSANRAALRNLTMPTMPNFEIPPSPPSSPPPGMEQKFEHFLQLKKQGVHFNERLAGSSALKNPGLLQKLMATAGLEVADQYATTLATELWDPASLPQWAYQVELRKSQQQVAKKKEVAESRTQRENIEFVPPANVVTRSVNGVRGGSDGAAER